MTVGIANINLILGQSNAMNYNTIGVSYPGGWSTQSLNGGYADVIWNLISQSWEQYVPGTNSSGDPGTSSDTAWGPEAAIALAARALIPQRSTYFLKYAVGNTGLARDPSSTVLDWSPYSNSKAFGAAMAQFDAAVASLAAYRFCRVDSCYWIGNETDSNSQTSADAMARDLPDFAEALRARTNSPDMKFIPVRTPTAIGGAYVSTVRSAQEAVGSLRRNAWVDADDLATSGGHYTPASVVTLGQRLFAAAAATAV